MIKKGGEMKRIHVLIAILIILILALIAVEVIERSIEKKELIRLEEQRKKREAEIEKMKKEKMIEEECRKYTNFNYKMMKKLKNDKSITIKNGVVFKDGKAIAFFPFEEFFSLSLSRESIRQSKEDILHAVELFFSDAMVLNIGDSKKTNPYFVLPETERELCYKIDGYTLYLKDPLDEKGEWEPLKIRFIEELEPDPDREHAQYPCMRVYLETKWFRGEYEVECE